MGKWRTPPPQKMPIEILYRNLWKADNKFIWKVVSLVKSTVCCIATEKRRASPILPRKTMWSLPQTCSTHTSDITQEGNMLSIMTLDLRLVCFHMHNWLAGVKLKSTYTTCYCGLHIEMVTESMPLCDHFVWTQRHRKSETFRKIGEKKNHTFMSLSLYIYITLLYSVRFGLCCNQLKSYWR